MYSVQDKANIGHVCKQHSCLLSLIRHPSLRSHRAFSNSTHASHRSRKQVPPLRASLPSLSDVKSRLANSMSSVRNAALAGALGLTLLTGQAHAADFVKTGLCLAKKCQVELARCLADGQCRENLICLQNCNGRENESQCQIRCGDLYAGKVVEDFNACAITKHNCVAARVDVNKYPEPPASALVNSFDVSKFMGQWNITAGQNDLFDTFDCQKHYFSVDEQGILHADINWRVQKSDGDFIERHADQTFKQNEERHGYLRNDGNDFLSYTDDWYILGWKPDAYAVIYYKGSNDAWKGYGGATVYTREESLPEEYVPEMTEAIEKVGLHWKDFKLVDNSCPPHPKEGPVQELVGAIADINPKKERPQESPVDIGQGPKYTYMEGDKQKTPAGGDQDFSLTQMAP